MVDPKPVVGFAATAGAASSSWLDIAEPIVTITVTLIVGAVTLWYTVERAIKLRRERTDGSDSST